MKISSDKQNGIVDLKQYKYEQCGQSLREKLIKFSESPIVQSQIGEAFYIWKNNPELLAEDIAQSEIDQITFSKFYDWFLFDFKLLNSGITIIKSFREENKNRLSKIENSILQEWISSICSFYILRQVNKVGNCEIQDIFSNKMFRVVDKSTATKVKPLTILCSRLLKVGSQNYFSDIITLYPYSYYSLILDFFNTEFLEFKKTFNGDNSYKRFLKEWGYLIFQYLDNISNKTKFITPDGSEFLFSIAVYDVYNFDQSVILLNGIKHLRQIYTNNNDIYNYTISFNNVHEIQGTIELEKTKLTIECYSAIIFKKAKNLINKKLKDTTIHINDYTKKPDYTIRNEKTNKPSLLPLGIKNKTEIDKIHESYYEEWLHKPLEHLDGKTPIAAAESIETRERLKSIIAELEQLYETARMRGEPYYDIDILRKKLNLDS